MSQALGLYVEAASDFEQVCAAAARDAQDRSLGSSARSAPLFLPFCFAICPLGTSSSLSGSSKMASVVVGARAGLAFAAGAAASAGAAPFCLAIIFAIGNSSSESLELMVLAAC